MKFFGCFFVLSLALAGCERIPEWERKNITAKNAEQARSLSEFRKWLWTCRASLPNYTSEKNPKLGQRVEDFIDRFRIKGLSSLEISEPKIVLGAAFLWNENGFLVVHLPVLEDVKDIECSNGLVPWIEAKVVGQDRSFETGVLKINLPNSLHLSSENRWVLRTDSLGFDESLTALTSPYPGEVDQLGVNLQVFHTNLNTGVDANLLFFSPEPTAIFAGGVLVDSRVRLVGYLGLHANGLWGTAVSAAQIQEIVSSVVKRGRLVRAYTGLKVRVQPDQEFMIQQIDLGGPAHQAGLRVQDRILKWNNRELHEVKDWIEVAPKDIGKAVSVTYVRSGKAVETILIPREAE